MSLQGRVPGPHLRGPRAVLLHGEGNGFFLLKHLHQIVEVSLALLIAMGLQDLKFPLPGTDCQVFASFLLHKILLQNCKTIFGINFN